MRLKAKVVRLERISMDAGSAAPRSAAATTVPDLRPATACRSICMATADA